MSEVKQSAEPLERTEYGAIAIGIIQCVVSDALRLAAIRWNLEISEEDNGMGDLDDMVDDIMACLVGEDYGCLDPDDEEDQAKIFQTVRAVAGKINDFIPSRTTQLPSQKRRSE